MTSQPGNRSQKTRPQDDPESGIKSLDMRVALTWSFLIHLFTPVALLALAALVMILMGLDPMRLFRPTPRPTQDLEFVLATPQQKEQPPLDPKTRYRAEKNMRAGGPHDPTRPVEMREPVKTAVPTKAQSQTQPKPKPQPVVKPAPPQKAQAKPQPKPPKKTAVQHQPPRLKPAVAVPAPLAKAIDNSPPVPQKSLGPIVRESAPASSHPAPVMDTAGAVKSTAVAGTSGSSGAMANGGPGNKNAALGVDAIKEPDFGPYMKELQRRIKESWRPPRGNESKRIVVVFRVNRAGKLLDIQVTHSSGEPMADQAAIEAVRSIFPFKPLPPDYTKENIDIEFTFDYNVFGDKHRLGNRYHHD